MLLNFSSHRLRLHKHIAFATPVLVCKMYVRPHDITVMVDWAQNSK